MVFFALLIVSKEALHVGNVRLAANNSVFLVFRDANPVIVYFINELHGGQARGLIKNKGRGWKPLPVFNPYPMKTGAKIMALPGNQHFLTHCLKKVNCTVNQT
jgi:hypothetical protein